MRSSTGSELGTEDSSGWRNATAEWAGRPEGSTSFSNLANFAKMDEASASFALARMPCLSTRGRHSGRAYVNTEGACAGAILVVAIIVSRSSGIWSAMLCLAPVTSHKRHRLSHGASATAHPHKFVALSTHWREQ